MPSILIHEHRDLRFALSSEGEWLVGGEKVSHPGIHRYLYSLLTLGHHGEPVLKSGPFELPVDVEDAPYVVVDIDVERSQTPPFILRLNDGSRESLVPRTLRFSPNNIPYCRVKEDRFAARFNRPAYYRLAEHVRHDSGGILLAVGVWSHRIEGAFPHAPGGK